VKKSLLQYVDLILLMGSVRPQFGENRKSVHHGVGRKPSRPGGTHLGFQRVVVPRVLTFCQCQAVLPFVSTAAANGASALASDAALRWTNAFGLPRPAVSFCVRDFFSRAFSRQFEKGSFIRKSNPVPLEVREGFWVEDTRVEKNSKEEGPPPNAELLRIGEATKPPRQHHQQSEAREGKRKRVRTSVIGTKTLIK